MEQPSFRFGSPDSQDIDVVFVQEKKPALAACQAFCKHETENRNIIVIEDGVIVDCYKGLPDEMNNALYHTYEHHEQRWPNPIQRPVERIVPLKVVRATRMILALLSRTAYRSEIKAALRSHDQAQRQEVLAQIDFRTLDIGVEEAKSIAFQLGQTLSLFEGQERYTKGDLSTAYPDLEAFLYRRAQPTDLDVLNARRDQLLRLLSEVYIRTRGSLNLFCYISSVKVRHWNPYTAQSRGIILDLKQERCVTFPYDKFFKLDECPGWMREDLPEGEPDEVVEKVDGSFVTAYQHEGQISFACKGNFDAEQARKAEEIATKYDLSPLDFSRYHYTFEVVYPQNRFPHGFALVDYGEEALFLTGIRERHTHRILPYEEVRQIALRCGLRAPEPYTQSFSQLLQDADAPTPWENFEGWVANFAGKRVKIKVQAYRHINEVANSVKHGSHRLLKRYSNDNPEAWQSLLNSIPEEFHPPLLQEVELFHQTMETLRQMIQDFIDTEAPGKDQAAFIDTVKTKVAQPYHKPLFRIYRDKPHSYLLEELALQKLLEAGKARRDPQWDFLL